VSDSRIARIRERLEQGFQPERLDIIDDSAAHAGHPGAARGGGHYRVRIVAEAFRGLALRRRHQAIYAVLDELMRSDIHALSIEARAPGEETGR
jgi:BolA protein